MEEIAEPLGVSFHLGLSRGEAWLDKPTALMKPPSAAFILANSTVPGLVSSLFPEVLPPTPQAAAMREFGSGPHAEFHPNTDTQGRYGPTQAGDPRLLDSPSGAGHSNARAMAKIMAVRRTTVHLQTLARDSDWHASPTLVWAGDGKRRRGGRSAAAVG